MDRRKLLLVVAVVVALLGAGLVFLYAKGADDRASEAYRPVTVYVATADLAVGESFDTAVATGKIISREVPTAIQTIDVLTGKTTNGPIFTGEQILSTNYGGEGANAPLAIPEGMVAISVSVSDTGRVAGFVNAGSYVAVWLNHTPASSATAQQETRLLLDRVQVIAVGSTSTQAPVIDANGNPVLSEAMPRAMITLAVDQDGAERIQLASRVGDLSFGLLTEKSKIKATKGTAVDAMFR
jgi:pilus assembly protein CpaB